MNIDCVAHQVLVKKLQNREWSMKPTLFRLTMCNLNLNSFFRFGYRRKHVARTSARKCPNRATRNRNSSQRGSSVSFLGAFLGTLSPGLAAPSVPFTRTREGFSDASYLIIYRGRTILILAGSLAKCHGGIKHCLPIGVVDADQVAWYTMPLAIIIYAPSFPLGLLPLCPFVLSTFSAIDESDTRETNICVF